VESHLELVPTQKAEKQMQLLRGLMLKAASHKLALKVLMLKVAEMASLEEQRQASALTQKVIIQQLVEIGRMLKDTQLLQVE